MPSVILSRVRLQAGNGAVLEGLVNTYCDVDHASMESALGSEDLEKLCAWNGCDGGIAASGANKAAMNDKVYAAIFRSILGLNLYGKETELAQSSSLGTESNKGRTGSHDFEADLNISRRRTALHCIRNIFEYVIPPRL